MIVHNNKTWLNYQDKIYHNGKKVLEIYKGTNRFYPQKPLIFSNLETWTKKLSYNAQIRINFSNNINYVSVDTKLHSYELLVIDIRNLLDVNKEYRFSFDMSHNEYVTMTSYGADHGFIFSDAIPPDTRIDNQAGKVAETEAFDGSKTSLQNYFCDFTATSELLSKPLYAIISFWCVNDDTDNTNFQISNLKLEEITEE